MKVLRKKYFNLILLHGAKASATVMLSRDILNKRQYFFPFKLTHGCAFSRSVKRTNRWQTSVLGVSGVSFFFSYYIGKRGFVLFMGLGLRLSRSKHFWWSWTNFGHHRQNESGKIPTISALSGGGEKNFLNSLIIGPSWILLLFHDASKSILVRCRQHQKQILLQLPVSVSAMAEGGGQPGVIPRAKNLQYVKLEEQFMKWNAMFYFYSKNSV